VNCDCHTNGSNHHFYKQYSKNFSQCDGPGITLSPHRVEGKVEKFVPCEQYVKLYEERSLIALSVYDHGLLSSPRYQA